MWNCFNGLQFFHKKSSACAVKSELMPNQELAEEIYKPLIKKFEK